MEKKPFLTESMAQDIIQDVPTPFHVYDEKGCLLYTSDAADEL